MRARLTYANVVSTIALIVAVGGGSFATAALVSRDGQVHACAKKRGKAKGQIRVVSSKARCRKGERKLSWSKKGPAGAVGAPGVGGVRGSDGAPGPAGPAEGPAGGDLAGSFPAPSLRDGSVTAGKRAVTPAARASLTGQSIPYHANLLTTTALQFTTEVYDSDSMFTTAAPNNDRLTITTPGVYLLTTSVRWDPNDTGARLVSIVKSDVGALFLAADTRDSATGSATRQSVSTVTRMDAGEFVKVKVAQNSGAALSINAGGAPQVNVSATWLSP